MILLAISVKTIAYAVIVFSLVILALSFLLIFARKQLVPQG
ncbi:MAG: hypothetical protein RLZZ248_1282, partial [Bacteroidota bacterium]